MGDSRKRSTGRAVWFAFLVSLIAPLLSVMPQTASAASVLLAWSSPTDNGARVSKYDLRVSMQAMAGNDTLTWWNRATRIPMTGKAPGMPGTLDSVLVGGLIMGVRYFAVLRSADTTPNWSGFSNMASFTPTLVTGAEGEGAPSFVLGSPRPTPTAGRADMNLELPKAANVDANVFDSQGRIVKVIMQEFLGAGVHVLHWDGKLGNGSDAASGVYWIRVIAENVVKKVKLVVVH